MSGSLIEVARCKTPFMPQVCVQRKKCKRRSWMPPFVRPGWHGCQSDRHRHESGEGSLKFEFRSLKESPNMHLSQRSSGADWPSDRAIASPSQRRRSTSVGNERAARTKYHTASIHGSFCHKSSVQLRDSSRRPNPRRVSVGTMPEDRATAVARTGRPLEFR